MSSDEILQNQIEIGNSASGVDADAYKIVFNSLKKEPQCNLSTDFAVKVSSLATPKKSFDWDKFILIAAGFGFVAALAYALILVKPTFSPGAFTFVSGYPGLIVFAIVFILFLNWLDKKLIKPSHS